MGERFGQYNMGEATPLMTGRGSYSYIIARPVEGAEDARPVVLMANEDAGRMSLCNAMEDVAAVIMKREKWTKEDKALWIETAEGDRSVGQVVARPASMPAWGPEKPVEQLLHEFQAPRLGIPADEPTVLPILYVTPL